MITQAMPVDYDSRTDAISPIAGRTRGQMRDDLTQLQAAFTRVIEPVFGWGPYTHLIATDGDDAVLRGLGPHYLVTLS